MDAVEVNKIKKLVHQEYSGTVLSLTVSGSHLYGFDSKDSDVDYRGCFQVDTNLLLVLHKPRDVIERMDGLNDVVLFELEKEVGLLQSGNCNVLEHLFAPQLVTSDEYFELRDIASSSLNISGIYKSYRGLAWENYSKFCLKNVHTVKKFLYVFRSILAGMRALTTKTIEPNIIKLLKGHESDYYYMPIQELINMKRSGLENDLLINDRLKEYRSLAMDLLSLLDYTYLQVRPSEREYAIQSTDSFINFDKFLRKKRVLYLKKNNGI